jgi:NADH-quinone oxidoreductase subunit F
LVRENILGTGYDLELYVHIGAGGICEETALIDIEGKEGNLVSNLHFQQFLDCNPTVVNNVETIASVPWIVNNSGDDYAKIGIEDQREPN